MKQNGRNITGIVVMASVMTIVTACSFILIDPLAPIRARKVTVETHDSLWFYFSSVSAEEKSGITVIRGHVRRRGWRPPRILTGHVDIELEGSARGVVRQTDLPLSPPYLPRKSHPSGYFSTEIEGQLMQGGTSCVVP